MDMARITEIPPPQTPFPLGLPLSGLPSTHPPSIQERGTEFILTQANSWLGVLGSSKMLGVGAVAVFLCVCQAEGF